MLEILKILPRWIIAVTLLVIAFGFALSYFTGATFLVNGQEWGVKRPTTPTVLQKEIHSFPFDQDLSIGEKWTQEELGISIDIQLVDLDSHMLFGMIKTAESAEHSFEARVGWNQDFRKGSHLYRVSLLSILPEKKGGRFRFERWN